MRAAITLPADADRARQPRDRKSHENPLREGKAPAQTSFDCHRHNAGGTSNGLQDVQYLAGHAHPRTTPVYDRRRRRVSRNLVERISV